MRRVHRILRAKRRVSKIWTAGIMPSMVYGSHNWSVSKSVLKWTRAKASSLTLGGGKHGHQSTAFLLAPERDPANRFLLDTVVRYASEIWMATDSQLVTPKTLRAGYLHRHMGKVLRNWNKGSTQVRGPLSAMLKSLQQLGWKMLNPFVLRDDKGQELHLAVGPPCVLRRHLQAALQRQHQSELEWKVITKSQVTDAEFEGLRRGGLSTWITKQFVNTDKHEFQSRRCIAQVATGKYVLAKHMQRYQLDVPGCCPLCSSADDSVYHRVFECPALLEQRRKALSEAMLNDALESGRHS